MEDEDIYIQESLDKHLMKRYFDQIINMNGEKMIKDIF